MDKNRLLKSDVVRLGVLMALCLALGVYLIATAVLISKDGVFYIGQAQNLARDPLGAAQRHPPGYPFLLWIAHEIAGPFARGDSVSMWIHASQGVTLLCRVLALIPLYFLGKSLIGGARAFWGILILIVLPYPAQYGSDVLTDWPYVMVLSLGLWLLYWALRRRTWWMLALVGLCAATGYLIQPAAVQLVLYGLLGLAAALLSRSRESKSGPTVAAVLLIAGFAVPVLPYVRAAGAFVPHQLRPVTFNSPPVITSVGGRGASSDPLEFEVREGELLETAVEASDSQGDSLTFSLATVPVGSRPVCQFRLTPGKACFATISAEEQNTLLALFASAIREYDGIVYYAYTQSDARAHLEPVHRFWSPTQQRHFYTILSSEKDIIEAQSPKELWTYEGIAFYAFAEGHQPSGAVPVHRYWSEQTGYSWAMAADGNSADDGVAWYVHVADEPPTGMAMQDKTLRWRPGPDQRGEYGINIIVSDGKMESGQLVKIRVVGSELASSSPLVVTPSSEVSRYALASTVRGEIPAPTAPPTNLQSAVRNPQSTYADWRRLAGAVDGLFDGFVESLMVFFIVPWGVGLYYRMRYEADRLERILTAAVIVANAGLILSRYIWVAPTMDRRYCLPLVALTILYVPVGLERIARWLSRAIRSGDKWASCPDKRAAIGFYFLAVIGVGVCLPKLLTPLYAEKESYLQAIQWLRDNTQADDVTAVPDGRLTFYAERSGLIYRDQVDPRRADYIVKILDTDAEAAPQGWSQECSLPIHDRRGRTLVIYRTHRRKGS